MSAVLETIKQSVVDMKDKWDEVKKGGLSADEIVILFQTSCCELHEIAHAVGDTPEERKAAYLEGAQMIYDRYLKDIDIPLVPEAMEDRAAKWLLEWAAEAFDDPILHVKAVKKAAGMPEGVPPGTPKPPPPDAGQKASPPVQSSNR